MGPGHRWLSSLSCVGEAADHPTLRETEGQSVYGRLTRGHPQRTEVRSDTNIQFLLLRPGGLPCTWPPSLQVPTVCVCEREKMPLVPHTPCVY